MDGICQTGDPGGEWCGRYGANRRTAGRSVGPDITQLGLRAGDRVVLTIRMWASDLYSMQFLCG